MQVIAAAPTITVVQRLAVARSAVVAALLVAAAASLAWLFIGTPFVGSLIPEGRPSDAQVILNVLVWTAVLVVPASLLLIGVTRLVEVIEAAAALRPPPLSLAVRNAHADDALAATDLRLPGGRRVHELVLGGFGIVVVGDVPPNSISRSVGSRWEIKDERGRWIPVESPVDRTSRDAERVRGWLAADDRDFVVKVYAVIVTNDQRVARSSSCAVVRPADFPAWVATLPPQRGLTASRRERVEQMVKEIAAAGTTR
ncbi:MAG: hypothetical protein U0838_13305 [Chloroflexota bacterium]